VNNCFNNHSQVEVHIFVLIKSITILLTDDEGLKLKRFKYKRGNKLFFHSKTVQRGRQ